MNDPSIFSDNNTNNSDYDHLDGPSLHTRIAFASAWVFIAVVGIIGNSLVICVAIRFEKLNNVTNCFIVNRKLNENKLDYIFFFIILVAITDIVFLIFCMPLLVVQYTLERW